MYNIGISIGIWYKNEKKNLARKYGYISSPQLIGKRVLWDARPKTLGHKNFRKSQIMQYYNIHCIYHTVTHVKHLPVKC